MYCHSCCYFKRGNLLMAAQGQREECIDPGNGEKTPKVWRIFGTKGKIEKIFK